MVLLITDLISFHLFDYELLTQEIKNAESKIMKKKSIIFQK